MAKFCPSCGNPLSSETLKFCPECGASVVFNPVPNVSTHTSTVVEEPAKEKIYYQDEHVIIGSKMWSFLKGRSGSGAVLKVNSDKHIPVQAISSVDYKGPSVALIIFGIVFIILLFPIGLIFIPMIYRNRELIIYTNNTLSTISFKGVPKDVAQKYLEPMIQCLQERQH